MKLILILLLVMLNYTNCSFNNKTNNGSEKALSSTQNIELDGSEIQKYKMKIVALNRILQDTFAFRKRNDSLLKLGKITVFEEIKFSCDSSLLKD